MPVFLLVALVLGAISLSFFGAVKILFPRGLRNKNPFNLRLTSIPWDGKVPNEDNTDGAFEQFFFDGDGIRAGMKNYVTDYFGSKQLKTLRTIIADNTPASENDLDSYVRRTAEALDLDPDAFFDLAAVRYDLAKRIILEENGRQPFPDAFLQTHVDRAFA